MAEDGRGVLEVDVDGAVEDAVDADVRLVGADRRVDRHQRHVVPQADQRSRERVVVDAGAAEHAGGTGGDVGDLHSLSFAGGSSRGSKSIRGQRPLRPRPGHLRDFCDRGSGVNTGEQGQKPVSGRRYSW